jgi:PAS domain S-box-containing protein
MSNLSFKSFLKEIRFSYLLATSILIIGLIFGGFEIIRITLLDNFDEVAIRNLHFSRGILTALSLLGWIVWTLYEFRKQFLAAIQHQGDQFKRIMNNASESIIITDKNHIITFWNDAATAMLGWNRNDVVGKKLEDIIKIPVASRFAKRGQQEIELDVNDQKGQLLFVALTMTSILDDDGNVEIYTYTMRNLTVRAIRQAQMARSERMASLGHMAAGVAHEIGNPLTAISSIIQLLQRKIKDETQLEQLGRVRENINRIARIVRDLVDFSRPKSPVITTMNLNDTITEAIGLLKHDARCRNVHFNLELESNLPPIQAVPDQLYQVYLNFILNAVDACDKVLKPQVTLRTESDDSNVIIQIIDNGSGIPPAIKERIFEPFFTTKEVGKGTGLGLSVSHNIISSLGGSIKVDSKPGHTCFTVTLPSSIQEL